MTANVISSSPGRLGDRARVKLWQRIISSREEMTYMYPISPDHGCRGYICAMRTDTAPLAAAWFASGRDQN